MRTLATREIGLAAQAVLYDVTCLRLTTFADRRSRYQPIEFYLSSSWRTAFWDGVEREFAPLLTSVNPAEDRISHVPMPELAAGGLAGQADRPCSIVLRGWDHERGAVLDWITSGGTRELIGSTVEIVCYLLERPSSSSAWSRIPSAAAPIPLWSGVVDSITRLGDELELALSAELPALRWRVADDPFVNDARDLGLRLPVVLGTAERVAAINWRVGAVTQLAAAAAIGATTLELTDGSGFPESGTISLGGGESATYTGKTGNQLTGVTGIAKNHGAGDTAVEQLVGDAVYVLSAEPASVVSALYVLAPWFQQLVRVTSAYTLTLADLNAVPGQAATTARFTTAQLGALVDAINLAAVAKQPRRSTDVVAPDALLPTVEDDLATKPPTLTVGTVIAGNLDDAVKPSASTSLRLSLSPSIARVRCVFPSNLSNPPIKVVQYVASMAVGIGGGVFISGGSVRVRALSNSFGVLAQQDFTVNGGVFDPDLIEATFTIPTDIDGDAFDVQPLTANAGLGSGATWILYSAHRRDVYRTQPGITTQPEVAENSGTDVQIRSASVGAGLRIFADVTGPLVPPAWEAAHPFDDGVADYSVSGCTVADDQTVWIEPTASVRVDVAAATPSRTQAHDNIAADASVVAITGGTKSTQTTDPAEGAGFGRITSGGSGATFGALCTVSPSENWTGSRLAFWVRVPASTFSAVNRANPLRLAVRGAGHESFYWLNDQVLEADTWTLCEVDLNDTADANDGTPATLNVVDRYALILDRTASGKVLDFDQFRVIPQPTGIAQRNAGASLGDWTATGGEYRVRLRCDRPDRVRALEIQFSDTTSSGTTAPAAYRRVIVPPQLLAEANGWARLRIVSSAVGSPTVSAVRTLRLVLQTTGLEAVAVWFDLLEDADGPSSPYYGAAGTVMKTGPDLIRYICENLSDPDAELDQALADAVGVSLGSNIYGADLRTLGETWPGVLEQLALCARSNLHPLEDANGQRWGLWSAEADGTFPAAVLELDAWENLTQQVEEERPPTEFDVLYKFDASVTRGSRITEEAFQGLEPVRDSAAAARRGPIQARPLLLPAVYDRATAIEVAGKLGPARTSPSRTFQALGVPWTQSFALTVGDVVTLTLPPELGGDPIAARVIGARRDFTSGAVDLTLREVTT